LFFDQVFVPETHRIGPERSGWALNRNVLNYSRAVVGAIALGIARGAVEAATRFARETRLGNRPSWPIRKFRSLWPSCGP
jgi:Acyl-CoA dehydrogenases